MTTEIIHKHFQSLDSPVYLKNYQADYAKFCWGTARHLLSGLPSNQGINMAYETVDRHANTRRTDHTAIHFLRKSGTIESWTYERLKNETNRFANTLRNFKIAKGDCVCALLSRVPELFVTALGSLKNQSIFCPLFSTFGPAPIKTRLQLSQAKVLVTTTSLYQSHILAMRSELPHLRLIILVSDDNADHLPETIDWDQTLMLASKDFLIPPTSPEDLALLHFTSGTTGKPKGVLHVHEAIISHHVTGRYALDIHPDDIFWCTADPGWVTGTSYGILSPLSHGATLIVDEGEYETQRWLDILREQKVSIWYTAPTALGLLMQSGVPALAKGSLPQLRFIASVGESLNPEAIAWGEKAFGLPIHDNWWQTETGGIMVANFLAMDIKPGSMGRAVPGVEATLVKRLENGKVERITSVGAVGELAFRKGWPSQFRGYLNDDARFRKCFSGDWYLSGDLAKCDKDGYYWFVGRSDQT